MRTEIARLRRIEAQLDKIKEAGSEEKETLKAQVLDLETKVNAFSTREEQWAQTKQELEAALKDMEDKIATKDNKIVDLIMTVKELNDSISDLENQKSTLEAEAVQHTLLRRKLHNEIQELKGNIRVFCRVRPKASDSTATPEGVHDPVTFPADDPDRKQLRFNGEVKKSVDGRSQQQKQWEFSFDKVFRPHATQETVFEDISQLVQSALDGYSVCVFAYGQTGSGKTYTMEGAEEVFDVADPSADVANAAKRGMIPRTMEQIFAALPLLSKAGWTYEITASYLEIYNESVQDLLSRGKAKTKYAIKHSSDGQTKVQGLTYVKVESVAEVYRILKQAKQSRTVASTRCNERSSRSHSVFQLLLAGKNNKTAEEQVGVINMIDLAGSERLTRSKTSGAHLKETQSINKSLSCLGDVIFALANKDKHVPYRNSKLTYLLKNSLGGNSKTLMFANISPEESSAKETLCSLRFAKKVNSCDISTAKRRIKR